MTVDKALEGSTDDKELKKAIEPYRQIPKIRVKRMPSSQLRHIERMITDPKYRKEQREADLKYNEHGRRAFLKSQKTPDELQRSRENSKRRAHLIQAVCQEFYPELYDDWKNGDNPAVRDQARAELVRLLDFTAGGDNKLPDKALQAWHRLYDRFIADKKAVMQEIKAAYDRGDAQAVQAGVDKYNSLCRSYDDEARNSDIVT